MEKTILHQLAPLPYSYDALEPFIDAETMRIHYGKHHQAYVNKLNDLVAGTPMAEDSLENIIKKSAGDASKKGVFNNAAQVWNHTFFWNSMKPAGGGAPTGELER